MTAVPPGGSAVPTVTGPDRISVLWRAKWLIALVVVVVTGCVYGASEAITPVYSSSATVRIAATQTPGLSASDIATASNDIAAQYAQIAKSSEVLQPAAASSGTSSATLDSHITAGTVASQNLIQITAQSTRPADARRWAGAVADSLRTFIQRQSTAQAAGVQRSIDAQLTPLDAEITSLQSAISAESGSARAGTGTLVRLESQENQLTDLISSRATLLSNTSLSVASVEPSVEVLTSPSAPGKVSPRPDLYAGVAAAGAILVAAEIALLAARRRLTA